MNRDNKHNNGNKSLIYLRISAAAYATTSVKAKIVVNIFQAKKFLVTQTF